MLRWIDRHPLPILAITLVVGAIGFLDSVLSIVDRARDIDFSSAVAVIASVADIGRLVAGPLALLVALLLLVRMRTKAPSAGATPLNGESEALTARVHSLEGQLAASERLAEERSRELESLRTALDAARADTDVVPAYTPSRWLPDPTDLSSLAMTNDDLDAAQAWAETRMQKELAPDAIVVFDVLTLAAEPKMTYGHTVQIDFRSWSNLADKGWYFSVFEDGEVFYHSQLTKPLSAPAERLWEKDATWPDLVRHSWYRVRPFTGNISVQAASDLRDIEWGQWSVHYTAEGDATPSHCWALDRGRLEPCPD